jgi:PTS system ascorbate-specific IIA component
MIAYLLITHDDLGDALLANATHVLGAAPANLAVLKVHAGDLQADVLKRARELALTLDTADGLIVFVDIYGATPANVACRLLDLGGPVEAFAGGNLPMLVKAVAYRNLPFDHVVAKTLDGALRGVVQISKDPCHAANG